MSTILTTRTETYSRKPIMFMKQLNYFIHTVIPIKIHGTENTEKESACSSIITMV